MFELSQDHEDFRASVRDFAEREVEPHVAQWDKDHHLPLEVVQRMGDLGLFGLVVPERWGGSAETVDGVCDVLVVAPAAVVCFFDELLCFFFAACSPGSGSSSMIALKMALMSSVRGISLFEPSVAVPDVGTVRNVTRPASIPCIESASLRSDCVSTPST